MKSTWAIAGLLGAILSAGCANTAVGLRSSAAQTGSSHNAVAIQVQASPNAYFGAFFLGYLAAGVASGYLGSSDGEFSRKLPPLAEDRAIAERDCSRPMQLPSANLRCK